MASSKIKIESQSEENYLKEIIRREHNYARIIEEDVPLGAEQDHGRTKQRYGQNIKCRRFLISFQTFSLYTRLLFTKCFPQFCLKIDQSICKQTRYN